MPKDPITSNTAVPSDDPYGTFRYEVRIPRHRIAVLIGTNGEIKKRIESETKTKLNIDSEEGDVAIEGSDVIAGFAVRDIVKAIGRGFNPDIALLLLKSDIAFELIELSDYVKSKSSMDRVNGRIIGKDGKSRELIEKLMEVSVCIQGKTVGIIGEIERVTNAKHAIEMLIEGAPHATVYKWMESKRRNLVKDELTGSKLEVKDNFKKYL
ncbi:MAG TPA: KH domain-containing protein [Acidobacteriota bacterium]|nr:KH domain-containing protein [Acidobacteriota bacterium]